MVDIVYLTYAVAEVEEIGYSSHDIINDDMLGHQVISPVPDLFLDLLGIVGAFQYLLEYCKAYLLVDAALSRIEVNISLQVNHAAAYDLDFLIHHSCYGLACGSSFVLLDLNGNISFLYTCSLDLHSLIVIDEVAFLSQYLACHGSDYGSCDLVTYKSGAYAQLLVILVSAET